MPVSINEKVADSLMRYGKKRLSEVNDLAKTKFGDSLIHVKVNREEERFDVIVQSNIKQADITDFEKLWSMCKVLKVS